VRRHNGEQVIHTEAQRLLCRGVPFDLDIAIRPALRPTFGVLGEQGFETERGSLLAQDAALAERIP
jgi:hypothetical protein